MRKHFKDAPRIPKFNVTTSENLEQSTLTGRSNAFSTISPSDAEAVISQDIIPIADPELYSLPIVL